MTIRAPSAAVLLAVLASAAGAAEPDAALEPTPANIVDESSRLGLYFRLTGLFLVPVPKSGEVELTNVNDDLIAYYQRSKVVSEPDDLRGWLGSTGRSSIPRARP